MDSAGHCSFRVSNSRWSRGASALALLFSVFVAPIAALADDVSDASAAFEASIQAYAADPSDENAAAMDAALEAYNDAVKANATDTFSTSQNFSSHTTLSNDRIIYVEDGATVTYSDFDTTDVGGVFHAGSYDLYVGSDNAALSDGGAASALVLSNNSSIHVGGAISSSADITIVDSTISENASGSHGGAIYSNGGALTIADSELSGNESGGWGGAIYSLGGTVTIADSIFSDNQGDYYGGAIYSTGTFTIVDSSFSGNTTTYFGGAVHSDGALTIVDSSFSGNSTTIGNGGAINSTGSLAVTGESFSENSAGRHGGAINFSGDEATITGVSFTANSADYDGGAIKTTGDLMSISGSSFSKNSADGSGGAINVYGSGNQTTITDSSFTANSAGEYGGAIYNFYSVVTTADSSFSNNTADEYGGAIYTLAGAVTITDSSFYQNSATYGGGAIYAYGGTIELVVTSGGVSVFSGNTANGEANSITFDTITSSGETEFEVSVAEGGLLDMRDPMGVEETADSVVIEKTGAGVWALGGANDFIQTGSGSTVFDVEEGVLYLYADSEVSNASATDADATVAAATITLAGQSSSFTLGGDATVVAAGDNAITADGAITLGDGATIRGGTAADATDVDSGEALIATGGDTALTLTADGGVLLDGELNLVAVASEDVFTLNADLEDNTENASTGSLVISGDGTVVLTRDSAYTGATDVQGGVLEVNGSIASSSLTTVQSGAVLSGVGTVGSTVIASGGALSPGSGAESIGALTVEGDLTFESGSIYAVDLAGDGSADQLVSVTGIVTIDGGTVTVTALDQDTSYQNGQVYTIITSEEGVEGSFDDTTVTSAFLEAFKSYDDDNVYLTIAIIDSDGSGRIFDTAAVTRNQKATAGALDTLEQSGSSLALYNDVLVLDAESARTAFDALSGEIYASVKSALIDQSRFSRDAVSRRIRAALDDDCLVRDTALPNDDGSSEDRNNCLDAGRASIWTQGYGSWGEYEGDANAGGVSVAEGGVFVGADVPVSDWRFGMIGGYGVASLENVSRSSSADADAYLFGAYAGTKVAGLGPGDIGLSFGATRTWYDVDATRAVVFPGFSEVVASSYDARALQVFAEAGYELNAGGALTFEPFASLAYVNLQTDGYAENGTAGLHGHGGDSDVTYTTLGLRAANSFRLGSLATSVHGALGWRHAFGETTPLATHAFTSSDAFSVEGAPIAEDVAIVEAGVEVGLTQSADFALGYQGQFSDDATENAFTASFDLKF
ncbi:MAG: hypothetical protein MnENMB40S_17670 [Rhizobiaceae bacterium MnEN-MB40S]|nr:MAG: hypothetical protein MnENMB40S_17670 [Rhizobiaceae bacterium MnEN-MB40S]